MTLLLVAKCIFLSFSSIITGERYSPDSPQREWFGILAFIGIILGLSIVVGKM